MPYQYTCPLCLEQLGAGEELKVFKIADASSGAKSKYLSKKVRCGSKHFVEEIIKFSGEDAFVAVDEQAVYVSHDGCRAYNPFWTKANSQLDIPGKYEDGGKLTAGLTCWVTGNPYLKELNHWMVKILRETYQIGNDYAAMWYPLQLLLATAAEKGGGLRRPYGSLVEMASTKAAGKTILTLQILNQALYRNGLELTIKDFFYPNADQDDPDLLRFKEKFYGEMFYHSMWSSTPISRPFGTVPSPGDLRAVFIQPVASEEQPEEAPAETRADGKVRRTSKFFVSIAGIFIGETFRRNRGRKKEEKEPPKDLATIIGERPDEFWTPIIFYDTAGELQEGGSPVTRAVRQLTNKLAICIDAREIFDRYDPLGPSETETPVADRNASIRHAYKRISELALAPRRKKAACVVVTKLDLVLSEEEKARAKEIAENPAEDESAREQLIRWLSDHADDDKRDLLSFLPKKRKLVDRVFFVWTENLPRMTGVRFSPIRRIEPQSAMAGEEVLIEANDGFDFEDAKKVTFNGTEAPFEILSKTQIRATVPEGATSGLVGLLLQGLRVDQIMGGRPYIDDATSDVPFTIKSQPSKDAVKTRKDTAKPRSYGLIKFLAWCLDKQVKEIARPANH